MVAGAIKPKLGQMTKQAGQSVRKSAVKVVRDEAKAGLESVRAQVAPSIGVPRQGAGRPQDRRVNEQDGPNEAQIAADDQRRLAELKSALNQMRSHYEAEVNKHVQMRQQREQAYGQNVEEQMNVGKQEQQESKAVIPAGSRRPAKAGQAGKQKRGLDQMRKRN